MKKILLPALLILGFAASPAAPAGAEGNFLDFSTLDASALVTENGATVTLEKDGADTAIRLAFPLSKGYPGFDLTPPDGTWDLSAFGAVSLDVTNDSGTKIGVAVRVENPGDWQQSPWNSEVVWLDAGASGTLTVNFGESFGKPGFALDPAAVKKIKIFVNPPAESGSVIIRSVRATGTPRG